MLVWKNKIPSTLKGLLTNFSQLMFTWVNTIRKRRQIWIKIISVYEDSLNINPFNEFNKNIFGGVIRFSRDPNYPAPLYAISW